MSRGWESKSVEGQQAEQASAAMSAETNAAPRPKAQGNHSADAEQKRRMQALLMQRERVLSERTSNPHRRTALQTALLGLEEELAQLGWTVHL